MDKDQGPKVSMGKARIIENPTQGLLHFHAYLSLKWTRPDWIWQNEFFFHEHLTLLQKHDDVDGKIIKIKFMVDTLYFLRVNQQKIGNYRESIRCLGYV